MQIYIFKHSDKIHALTKLCKVFLLCYFISVRSAVCLISFDTLALFRPGSSIQLVQ